MITDEMVARAWGAFEALPMDAHYSQAMRAAIEAVAPALIAAELRKWGDPAFDVVGTKTLRERAQELDPQ